MYYCIRDPRNGTCSSGDVDDDGEDDARRKVVVFNLISLRKHHVVEFMKKVRASTSHSLVVLAGCARTRMMTTGRMINEGR